MEFSLVSAHKSCLGWAWSHRNPATEIRHPLSSRYFGLHQKMESLVESHNYQQSLGLRLSGLLSRLSQIHKQIQIKRETRRVLRLRQLKNKNTQKHWNDVTWVKTREESATIPQAQTSFVSPESPRENTALASKLGICGTMSKMAMTSTSMPTMCLKLVSEKGLAHISECPLPEGVATTATTLGLDFSCASDPLDGICLRKRPNSPL